MGHPYGGKGAHGRRLPPGGKSARHGRHTKGNLASVQYHYGFPRVGPVPRARVFRSLLRGFDQPTSGIHMGMDQLMVLEYHQHQQHLQQHHMEYHQQQQHLQQHHLYLHLTTTCNTYSNATSTNSTNSTLSYAHICA